MDLRPGEIVALLVPPCPTGPIRNNRLREVALSTPGWHQGRRAAVICAAEDFDSLGDPCDVLLVDGLLDVVGARIEEALWLALASHRQRGAAVALMTSLDRHAVRCDRIVAFSWSQIELERELPQRHREMRRLLDALLGSWTEEDPSAVAIAARLKEAGAVTRALLRELWAQASTKSDQMNARRWETEVSLVALSDRVLDAIAAEVARFDRRSCPPTASGR
jgi:hypothetical protein